MSTHAVTETERWRTSLAARTHRVVDAERRAELIVGGLFTLAAVALAVTAPSPSNGASSAFSPLLAAAYVLGMAAVSHARIDVGAGFTVPTQALFVPMLFALPASLVPLLVALSLALAVAPLIASGRLPVSRLLTVPANSWFALGPAVVLALAHDQRPDARWDLLILALFTQFACDFTANALRERVGGGVSVRELAGEVRLAYLIDLALTPLGLAIALASSGRPWAVLALAPLFCLLSWFSKERRARLEQLIELNDAYRGTALLLGDVVEADDSYTGEHCKDVVTLALGVARELKMNAEEQRTVEFAALLHDIGKIAVPKEIVNKPGKLDPHEWEIIKTHTVEGQRMLERVGGFMGKVGQVVRCHHERWDGTGYPDGLRELDIPLEARIISCCDAYNAMTTTRSYRKAMPREHALAELTAGAGSQFDPKVVHALVSVLTVGDGRAS